MTTAAGAVARRNWTHSEEEALRILAPLGGKACALAFGRSLKSIHRKAAKIGVSMRRRSSGDKWGITSPATLRRVRELSEASLCPACGFRFAAVKTTGLCGLCHVKRLTAVHQEEIVKADAQRELWAVRSKLQRRRRSLAEEESVRAAAKGDAGATIDAQVTGDAREGACTR